MCLSLRSVARATGEEPQDGGGYDTTDHGNANFAVTSDFRVKALLEGGEHALLQLGHFPLLGGQIWWVSARQDGGRSLTYLKLNGRTSCVVVHISIQAFSEVTASENILTYKRKN